MANDDRGARTARDEIRAHVNAAREARPADERDADDLARARRVLKLIDELVPATSDAVVACYLSREFEPGTIGLIDALSEAHPVLVPKLTRQTDSFERRHPDWAWFTALEDLQPGPFGIPDPASPGLGADVLGMARVVIASALQAGPDGSRLGTGGGWFDRALLHLTPGVPVVVLINDDEVVEVAQRPHDRPVDWLVTPTRTIRTQPVEY